MCSGTGTPWFVVSCGSAGEPAEMFGQNGHRYSGPGGLTQHVQDRLAGGAIDPDVRGAFQGLCISAARAFDYSHVILEGVSVGVDLDVFHLRAVLAQVFVERDETRPARANETDHAWPAA